MHHVSAHLAGHYLQTAVPLIGPDHKIGDVLKLLERQTKDFETINYVYVLDKARHPVGVLTVKDVFRHPASKKVDEVMFKELVVARVHSNKERVAQLALKHNLKAIPVVDKNNLFLGVVPSDAILQIIKDAHAKDLLHTKGVFVDNESILSPQQASVKTLILARIPWLLMGVGGGLIAARVIEYFHFALERELLLAAFIPLVVYLGDAVGGQTQTLFIRAYTLGQYSGLHAYAKKEMKVGVGLGLLLSSTITLVTSLLFENIVISLILGISIFCATFLAVLVGMIVPASLFKMKKDPAIAAGPFGTILRDTGSIIIYFLVALVLLRYL